MAYFKTGANDYSSLQYNNLTPGNIKKGVTVTVKDSNNTTLKTVTGTYETSTQALKGHTYRIVQGSWTSRDGYMQTEIKFWLDGVLKLDTWVKTAWVQEAIRNNGQYYIPAVSSGAATSGGYNIWLRHLVSGDGTSTTNATHVYLNGFPIYQPSYTGAYNGSDSGTLTFS